MAEVPIFTEHLAPILMEPERQEEFLYFGESADSDSAHSPSERSASDILPAMLQQQLGRDGVADRTAVLDSQDIPFSPHETFPTQAMTTVVPWPSHSYPGAMHHYGDPISPALEHAPFVPYYGRQGTDRYRHDLPQTIAHDQYAFAQTVSQRQLGNDPQDQQSLDARYCWDFVHGTSLNHLAPPRIPAWQWANGGTNHTSRAISSGQCPVYTSALGDQYTILPQVLYEGGLRAAILHPTIQFYGFNLQSAFQQDVEGLVDPHGQAFQVQLKQKMSVISLFPGLERHTRQVHVHPAHKTSHTRGKLANVIAKEMVQFMAATSKEGKSLRSQEGKIVELQDLVLVDICHVSQGSLQPTIGVIRRS